MTIDDFWHILGCGIYCCDDCPVHKYHSNILDCKEGCAYALSKLYDELCKGKVKVGDEIYEQTR